MPYSAGAAILLRESIRSPKGLKPRRGEEFEKLKILFLPLSVVLKLLPVMIIVMVF
jgi:hypothetical protein